MTFFDSPVAKRTRHQWELFYQTTYQSLHGTSSRNQTRKRNRETGVSQCGDTKQGFHQVIDVDEYESEGFCRSSTRIKVDEAKKVDESLLEDELQEEKDHINVSGGSTRLNLSFEKSIKLEESSLGESKDKESDAEETAHLSMEKSDGVKESNDIDVSNIVKKHEGDGSASSSENGTQMSSSDSSDNSDSSSSSENGTQMYSSDSSDNSDSDDIYVPEEQEEADKDLQTSRKYHHGSTNYMKACPFQSTEDDPLSSSESDDESFFSLPNKSLKQPTTKEQSPMDINPIYISSDTDESEKEGSDAEESHLSLKESDGLKETDSIELSDISTKSKGYGSANSFKTDMHAYTICLSDDSDSDNTVGVLEEQEDTDEALQKYCKYHHDSQSNSKEGSFQSTDDGSFGSSESERDKLDDVVFSLRNKRPNHPTTKKQSPLKFDKDKVRSGLVETKEKNRSSTKDDDDEPLSSSGSERNKNQPTTKNQPPKKNKSGKDMNRSAQKSDMKKMNQKPMAKSSDVKMKDSCMKVEKANAVKYQNSKKGRQKYGGSIDDILDSITRNEAGLGEKGGDRLPLKFRFEDSEDESMSQKTDEFNAEGLFEEMDFVLKCEEMGSYRTPTVNNQEKDDHSNLCERGEHGDIYLEEQTGLRCRLCGAVVLESRYVISKLANYAPDKSKRSYHFDEQRWSSFGNPDLEASDCNSPDIICNETKGTVWELIPTSIRSHLYPHQQQGFKFLWENLAGTIELSGLQKLGPRGGGGGGGCIISHAPGTGKTLLTIVFVETFLKRFPRCCPVIVAPASMLLTWEAEFKKWQVGFSFINLNTSEFLRKERISSRRNKDFIRAMKIHSWSKGGSVLGISYNLYTKVAGNSNTRNKNLEKMRNFLLDMPGLVVLDEGHTPRNKNSNIWNTLLKLKTKNRVILSGTPFQNNFKELFNTLRLVRPETATNIVNEKIFADMIQQNMKRSRSRSTYEDVKKLKKIISPFVHVHKGHILESKLPGLKQTVILLDPPPIQKSFIENLGNMTTTFEYEHKVALVSVHPSLILHCSLSEKEEKSVNKQQLEKVRLQPDYGVKTRFVMELIRLSVSLQEKVLIFSQYLKPLELLQDQIARAFGWDAGTEIMVIKGKINQMHRQTIINDFNDPVGKVKVLLASTRCCSEGIHLYGASRVVLLDVVWNPSVERQAISRAYRLGQKKVVYTYHLMAAGTTEEDKYDRQVEKGRLAEMVFSSASMGSTEVKEKVNVDDKILQHIVDHQELKHMFKKIRYPENQTRV